MPARESTDEIGSYFVAKRCELCSTEFGCGSGGPGCWCEAVEVPRERLLPVRSAASDCLCPRCLEAVAAGRDPLWSVPR
jgi:cysteine-rich CWC protein